MQKIKTKAIIIEILIVIYAIILVLLNLAHICNDNYWADEAYTIMISRLPVLDLINTTANDVHPPLYYLIFKAFITLFGESSYAFRIVSIIPYFIIMIFALTNIRKKWGNGTCTLFITLISLLYSALDLNTEIRMYSWASFFILFSFFSLLKIIETDDNKYYISFVITSLRSSILSLLCFTFGFIFLFRINYL